MAAKLKREMSSVQDLRVFEDEQSVTGYDVDLSDPSAFLGWESLPTW